MSDLEKYSPRQRISCSTLFLQPGETVELFVFAWIAGLSIRSTDEDAVRVKTPVGSDGRCSIVAIAPQAKQVPRIELVMTGGAVWDYVEVSVLSGPLPRGFMEEWSYVHPGNRKVQVTAFWAKSATPDSFARSAEVSRLVLARHGLTLVVTPGVLPTAQFTLPFNDQLEAGADLVTLREQVEATGFWSNDKLVVIVVPYAATFAGAGQDPSPYGETHSPDGALTRPFVDFNSAKSSPTGVTLVHEMHHAADMTVVGHECAPPGSPVADIMNDPTGRIPRDGGTVSCMPNGTAMYRRQVVRIANAFYAKD